MTEQQKKAVRAVRDQKTEQALWYALQIFQGELFYTSSGLEFTYSMKIGRNGEYTKELFVDRREKSKSLSGGTVRRAFQEVMERGEDRPFFSRPKELGDLRGISYVYPMFYYFGIIDVPEKAKENMRLADY